MVISLSLVRALSFSSAVRADEPPPRSPEETAQSFVLPAGFSATVFAGEPDVVQPIGMAIDDRGRVWVAENLSYPNWKATGSDRIAVFEDADGDGRHDRRTVFYDKLNYVTGLEVGFGGVWVVSAPNLLFIPDGDGDDKPDGEPQVLLDGFGHQGVHNLVNGCTWGPDGWLYGGHGGSSSGLIGKPGSPDGERTFFDGGVWRYHPVRHAFEVFMRGTTNPWGLDFDELGQAFISNSVTPHLYHVIQGAHVERRKPSPSSRHAYAVIDSIADHSHWVGEDWTQSRGGKPEQIVLGGGHAHSGLMIYQGYGWPDEYRGMIFMLNIHGDRVNVDVPRRAGSGYVASHDKDFLVVGDPWFQGLQLRHSPDGHVYLSDWYDTGECHTRKPDIKNGRIYRIRYKPGRATDNFADFNWNDLVDLACTTGWPWQRALRVLHERAAAGRLQDRDGTRSELRFKLLPASALATRLKAMWAMHVVGGISDNRLRETLFKDRDEHVRAWAIRLAADDREVSDSIAKRFARLATSDPSPVVRLNLASASMRLPDEQRWPIVEALAARDEDANDRNLPLMVWYALEPLVTKDPERALRAVERSKLPRLREFVARRIVTGDQ